ncbi:MAG TPA: hypothetical protein VGY57_10690 [Vicinamibacterales bacterium]|nr:hypothetical protein [Vicinamibacterales bacterium]
MSSRQDGSPAAGGPLRVEDVMRQVQDDVRVERRRRLLARGASPAYRDPAVFEAVEQILRRAAERRPDGLLLPDLLSEEDWLLDTKPIPITSHRSIVGPLIVLFKRRVALPMTRWLYQYLLENLRRQQRVNRVLFACIEELAVENTRLRQDVERGAAAR